VADAGRAAAGRAVVERIAADDDVALALHRLGPRDATPVLLTAGTFANASFWLGTRGTGFARQVAAAGFEACILEFRGHGASQRPARGQRWSFDDWGRRDLPAAVRALADGGRRPILIGHSAGGAAILTALAAEADVRAAARAAAIIATPLPWLQHWHPVAAWVLRTAARLLPAFPARLLRLGPEDELPGVMTQWLDWNRRGTWTGDDGIDYAATLRSLPLPLPLLFLAGAGDHRFAPPHAVRALFDLVLADTRTFVLAGTGTGYRRDYGHADLIVSRSARAEIWPLLLSWIRRHDA
jgi:predicted alpha/beta hydrolase